MQPQQPKLSIAAQNAELQLFYEDFANGVYITDYTMKDSGNGFSRPVGGSRENVGAFASSFFKRGVTDPKEIQTAIYNQIEVHKTNYERTLNNIENMTAQDISLAISNLSLINKIISITEHRFSDATRKPLPQGDLLGDKFSIFLKKHFKNITESQKEAIADALLDGHDPEDPELKGYLSVLPLVSIFRRYKASFNTEGLDFLNRWIKLKSDNDYINSKLTMLDLDTLTYKELEILGPKVTLDKFPILLKKHFKNITESQKEAIADALLDGHDPEDPELKRYLSVLPLLSKYRGYKGSFNPKGLDFLNRWIKLKSDNDYIHSKLTMLDTLTDRELKILGPKVNVSQLLYFMKSNPEVSVVRLVEQNQKLADELLAQGFIDKNLFSLQPLIDQHRENYSLMAKVLNKRLDFIESPLYIREIKTNPNMCLMVVGLFLNNSYPFRYHPAFVEGLLTYLETGPNAEIEEFVRKLSSKDFEVLIENCSTFEAVEKWISLATVLKPEIVMKKNKLS